jgi:ribosomal protein S1
MAVGQPLKRGVIIDGFVKKITNYGAFIDLGGIDGLLHLSQISWQPIHHPGEVLGVGDRVKVLVLKYDPKNKKVTLGRKQLIDSRGDADLKKRRRLELNLWEKKCEREDEKLRMRAKARSKQSIYEKAGGSGKYVRVVPGGLPSLGRKK